MAEVAPWTPQNSGWVGRWVGLGLANAVKVGGGRRLKSPPFEYHAPDSIDGALALLQEHGDEAKVLAGGQSLIPLLARSPGPAGGAGRHWRDRRAAGAQCER